MATTVIPHLPPPLSCSHKPEKSLADIVERIAHLLPSQGPISVFVHHNTLHAFEDMQFSQALVRASEVYGCESYLSESRYRQEVERGRIRHEDLAAVLQDDLADSADELVGMLGTRFYLRLAMLKHQLHMAPSDELRWVIAETDAARKFREDVPIQVRNRMIEQTRRWIMRDLRDGQSPATTSSDILRELSGELDLSTIEDWDVEAWEALTLQLLWRVCLRGADSRQSRQPHQSPRPRDLLLTVTGVDADELVHDLLIRFSASSLDQGFAHWMLPGRDKGFYGSFVELYGAPGVVAPRWLHGLREELQQLRDDDVQPLESIQGSLAAFGVDAEEQESFVTASLLALPGWAGMIWQLETAADWAVHPVRMGSLIEFLAVRLILDRYAATHIARSHLDFRGNLPELRRALAKSSALRHRSENAQRAFEFFQIAQVLGISPQELHTTPPSSWSRLASEIEAFSEIERRRTFHLAYERRYYQQTLGAVAAHVNKASVDPSRSGADADFQIICCIDDREESFRRHLEEVHPKCETFGYAAFFGVAMYYRGAGDAHPRPLCPVIIKPKHYVEELPVFTLAEAHERRARTRRLLGTASHYFHRGSRSLVGGAFTALVGSLATAPLVARILFPRTASQLRRLFGRMIKPPEATQLLLERAEPTPGPEDGHIGYSVDEMADIVERTLRDNGLTVRLAPLVILCGHGSSSLNNPHESAYNCGACSGGRGGPNARAFAQMANDPRVRSILASRGRNIPPGTFFVGAYHNTCNDAVVFFDLQRLPSTHTTTFATARKAIQEAGRRNAHERCRRFESASLALSPKAALIHVEQRSEDLSQARPEYNHATNAVTFVGRRSSTRGLFMDRRCFLASYDPLQDDAEGNILARILAAVIPVCAGISLEYYFSTVDPQGYGCGSKLPHNIVSLLGVMEGALSDLRPGLSAQMVEIHEPMRQLFIIETTPRVMERIIEINPTIGRLCRNEWVQLVTIDPHDNTMNVYKSQRFERYEPEPIELPQVAASADWYRGWRDNLGYAEVAPPNDIVPSVEDRR